MELPYFSIDEFADLVVAKTGWDRKVAYDYSEAEDTYLYDLGLIDYGNVYKKVKNDNIVCVDNDELVDYVVKHTRLSKVVVDRLSEIELEYMEQKGIVKSA